MVQKSCVGGGLSGTEELRGRGVCMVQKSCVGGGLYRRAAWEGVCIEELCLFIGCSHEN